MCVCGGCVCREGSLLPPAVAPLTHASLVLAMLLRLHVWLCGLPYIGKLALLCAAFALPIAALVRNLKLIPRYLALPLAIHPPLLQPWGMTLIPLSQQCHAILGSSHTGGLPPH